MTKTPRKPPAEATLIEPDEATQREVMAVWNHVDRLTRHGRVPTIRAAPPQEGDGRPATPTGRGPAR